MSSIPLVALSVKPPEQPDFLGNYAKVMQLRHLAQAQQQESALASGQQQIQQQTVQENELKLQQQQQAAKDQQAAQAAFQDPDYKSLRDLPELLRKHGASADTVLKAEAQSRTNREADLKLSSEDFAFKIAKSNALLGRLQAGNNIPDEQLGQWLGQQIPQAIKDGLLDPQHGQQIQQMIASVQDPKALRSQLNIFEKGLMGAKEQDAQTAKEREDAETQRHNRATEVKQPPTEASLAFGSAQGDATSEAALKRLDQSKLAARPPNTSGEYHDQVRADKSYQFNSSSLDKLKTPIDALVARLGRLNDTLAQNTPQADALIAPELMTVMAGGQGSGIRINEAEINRVVGGRSKWESLKAAVNKWQLDPKAALSITPEQRQEIRALTKVVNEKVSAKQQILDDARQSLIGTDDPTQHRKIVADANSKLSQIDRGDAAQGGAQAGEIHYKIVNGQLVAQ